MANPFATHAMAEGYAAFRPPLHQLIMERVKASLRWPGELSRALDVGCGAGLSTRALNGIASHRVGIDPAAPMLPLAAATAPGADFIAGRAEALPVRAQCINLITAAGSLNYVDLPLFFQEAARILVPEGMIVVYDFSPGQAPNDWLSGFLARYPWPPNEAAALNPDKLRSLAIGFRLQSHEEFEIGITLSRDFYLEYMMTETNVAHALRGGVPEAEIRSWCAATLFPVWGEQPREVLFRGYFVCLASPPNPPSFCIPDSQKT